MAVSKTDLSCFESFMLCLTIHKHSVLSWHSMMEVLILRFPHLSESIFDQLVDQDLVKCREASKIWHDYVAKQKFFYCRKIQKKIENIHDFGELWTRVLSKVNTEISIQLFWAVEKFFAEKFFAEKNDSHHSSGSGPLHIAANVGNVQIVEYIFKNCDIENLNENYSKINVGNVTKQDSKNPRNHWGETPLHYAASKGHLKVCEYIVDKVEVKNPKDINGSTPLHYAAINGYLQVYNLIMPKVQDKNPFDVNYLTPLHYAGQQGYSQICEYILDNIDNKNPYSIRGVTPLDLAAERGHLQVCKSIVNKIPNLYHSQFHNALFYAVQYGHFEVCKYMIKTIVEKNWWNQKFEGLSSLAQRNGFDEIFRLIRYASNMKI